MTAQAAALRELDNALTGLWGFGSNALVGWTPSPRGMEVISVPKARLFQSGAAHRRVFAGDRIMGQATFRAVARALEVEAVELSLRHPVGDGPAALDLDSVDRMFSRFTVTKTRQRGVFLIDIVAFSLYSPEEQASQLAALEFALNIANESARRHGMAVELARSTTGDGFYVWNREKGLDADQRLFCVFVLALVFLAALRQAMGPGNYVPAIRCCFGVGSHYSYPDPDHRRDSDYIVGDVTISLARLIGKAKPGQILIAQFARQFEETEETLSTTAFVDTAVAMLEAFRDIQIPGAHVERVSIHLTGPRRDDGGYRVQRLKVTDKHGLMHYCYNAKIDIAAGKDQPIHCGLRHDELLDRLKARESDA